MNKPNPIPFCLTIGVTGHRKLEKVEVLRKSVKKAINSILENFPASVNTSFFPSVLTPLAEGADRLVAEEVLKYDNAELKVILPLCTQEYLEDFSSGESKKEFEVLLSQADYKLTLNTEPLRENFPNGFFAEAKKQAYEDVGRYIVNHSDVLIAIWDELPSQGKGGTANIVQYAKSKGCPIFIINPNLPEEIKSIKGNGLDKDLFKQIDKFNSYGTDEKTWNKCSDENSKQFFSNRETGDQYNLPEQNKTIINEFLLPYYTHSEIFALKNQKWYKYIGLLVYGFSFLSVSAVGYGEIFFDHIPRYIFILEFFFLLIISLLIFVSRKRATHRNYIENRFLAEHLRTDIILTLCGKIVSPPRYLRHIKSTYAQNGWMILILEYILAKVPTININPPNNIQIIRDFVRQVWINSQIDYHKKRIEKIWNKNEVLEYLGEVIFYLAILIAFIHIFFTIHLQILDNILILSVLLLPALGATLSAIKTHRDYKKIITDSTIILNELENLDYEFNKTLTQKKVDILLGKAENIMRRESEEWLTLLTSKELEKAV